jgi:hypothetical protein
MFEDARLKIRRGERHIGDLKTALEAYCKSNFCRIGVEADPKDGIQIVKLDRTREVPPEIPLGIGDAVHNLRSSLDFLACGIVRSGSKQPGRFTRFPFEHNREKLAAVLESGPLKAARPDLVNLIVDTIKPYKGGDDDLFGLHDLDIDDRYKLIVPVFTAVALRNVSVRNAEKRVLKIGRLELGPRGEIQLAESVGKAELASYEDASFAALFDTGSAFDGQAIVPTLQRLCKLVSAVIDQLEQAAESSRDVG